MHPNNPHGNPQMGQGGYMPQQPGQPQQPGHPGMAQQQQMGYYQPTQGQPGQPPMMRGAGGSMPMQGSYPAGSTAPGGPMMSQPPVQQHPSMMQQAMFSAQGAMGRQNVGGFPQQSAYSGSGMPGGAGAPTSAQYSQGGPMLQQPAPMGSQAYSTPHQGSHQAGVSGQQSMAGLLGSSAQQHPSGAHPTAPHPQQHATKTETKRPLNPHPYSPEILENLDKVSVGALCMIGKELVHELNLRTSTMCTILKATSERKHMTGTVDVDTVMEYCLQLFDRLTEIRIRIEKKSKGKELNVHDLITQLTDMSEPVDPRPERLREAYQKFDNNKNRLVALNNDLKLLDWMSTVSDPGQLKKTNMPKTSIFRSRVGTELMMGKIVQVTNIGIDRIPCAQVRCSLNEFNIYLKKYFARSFDYWVLDKQSLAGLGDTVLIKRLEGTQRPTAKVAHSIDKVVFKYGNIIDPVTGKRVLKDEFEDETELKKQLVQQVVDEPLQQDSLLFEERRAVQQARLEEKKNEISQ